MHVNENLLIIYKNQLYNYLYSCIAHMKYCVLFKYVKRTTSIKKYFIVVFVIVTECTLLTTSSEFKTQNNLIVFKQLIEGS